MRNALLSHYLNNWLHIYCCTGKTLYPVGLLVKRHGDQRLMRAIGKLRCKRCGKPPRSVWLCGTHMARDDAGVAAGWSLELL